MLRGRDDDRRIVDDLLDGARAGRSGVLVVHGDPGIGKTALLGHLAERATGLRILRSTGVETEAELPFAALHQLLRPVLTSVSVLPEPQSNALKGALGLAGSAGEDRFLIGLATLSLLSETAEEGPLVCLVDDAHWLDQSSAEALLFAARRLDAEGIVLVFATRDGFRSPGLPELRLGPLDAEAASALLSERAPDLPEGIRARILAESGGNPLALIELPRTTDAHSPLPLPGRIQEAYGARLADLPHGARLMILLAAAETAGDLGVILRAGATLGIGAEALGVAERSGFLSLTATAVSFVHPLMRAAAFHAGTFDQRFAVHGALAEALHDQEDRQAWHLAAVALGPDERAAAALERSAERARERHGHAAAATALERAAELTADRSLLARRLTEAAVAAADAGSPDRAQGLAERAAHLVDDPRSVARLAELRARVAFERGSVHTAHDLLVSGAEQVADLDPVAAGLMLVDAGRNAWQLSDPGRVAEAAALLRSLRLGPEDGLDTAVHAVAAAAESLNLGPARALSGMRPLVEDARRIRRGSYGLRINGAFVAGLVGDFAAQREISAAVVEECRTSGVTGLLPVAYVTLASAELYQGRFRSALADASEGLRIASDIGQPHRTGYLEGILAWVAAVEGDDARCAELAVRCADHFAATGIANGLAWAQWASAMLDLSRGRHTQALDRLEDALAGPVRHQIQAVYFGADQVEAAVRAGQPDRAKEPLARFAEWATAAGCDWSDAVLLRCRALVEGGEEHFTAALRLHGPGERPMERARTELLYGEWLRRERRKREARTHLRSALEIFHRLGARPWADRAGAELRAAGEATTPSAAPDRLADLSPQELQIVRLAVTGLTNKEIGARLFVSPKTVSYHLYRAFPKLGVSSRIELARLDLGEY
ncbi:helix-turn-helix transcriptional regulator [Planotetraspora mira]|jgi:DNA-binding CsgD family transcriptional regulator|uniref:LuxR family transcriptional regulator n=1 Tax=Planotetraspora mira TaxID=58121 RepID=A0A8J3X9I4_9ACTN|nr:LuxR family transcriptional regulator [Planotetraspora mira]GII28578.1 LuxR family transcriptional regulator [Planotetraspora mira]